MDTQNCAIVLQRPSLLAISEAPSCWLPVCQRRWRGFFFPHCFPQGLRSALSNFVPPAMALRGLWSGIRFSDSCNNFRGIKGQRWTQWTWVDGVVRYFEVALKVVIALKVATSLPAPATPARPWLPSTDHRQIQVGRLRRRTSPLQRVLPVRCKSLCR